MADDTTTTTCATHPNEVMVVGYQGPECSLCERAKLEARGCRCGGSSVCADCAKVRANTGDVDAKCSLDCDGLCSVCCPDS
jgi:hypothetical protein